MAFARTQARSPAERARRVARSSDGAVHTTLLELVRTIGEVTEDEAEIVATVIQMLRSGRVKLCGTFRDEPLGKLLD